MKNSELFRCRKWMMTLNIGAHFVLEPYFQTEHADVQNGGKSAGIRCAKRVFNKLKR